jgi:hypothetical protein
MTLLDEQFGIDVNTVRMEPVREPRRLRGLRFPVLPKASWLVQVSGGIAALSGVWMQWGTAVALMAGGIATVVVSMLDESGMLKEDDKGKG